MREIKFRVWDYDTNTMVYPDSKLETIFCFDKVGLSVYHSNGQELSSFEVMQYTGLKDKNGKEIYEGDIIKHKYSSTKTVWFKNGAFVMSYGNSNVYLLYNLIIEDGSLIDWEVVGNIYEDLDLLQNKR